MFQNAAQALESHLLNQRSHFHCSDCAQETPASFRDALNPLHTHCGFRDWQQAALHWIEHTAGQGIVEKLNAIETYKNTISCHMCGVCCRMASVDKPYNVLLQQAQQGDAFAQQFTSIFLPYESRDAARQKAPDVVTAVLAEAEEQEGEQETIFFYHCPYVGEDNRCSVYGTPKRPALCASYPETPLSYIDEQCAWHPWKADTYADTLLAHALLAYCTDLSEKLKTALGESA